MMGQFFDQELVMEPVTLAFLFGGLSAASLPLGAAMGLWLRPGLKVTAAVMAFGAGALLCALALELVVPALERFPDRPMEGFKWLSIGSMIGCILFIGLDHSLSGMGAWLRKSSTITLRLKRRKKRHFQQMLNRLSVLDLMVNLPPKEIRRVLADIEKRAFVGGEIICHEEDPCDALFLIETGSVRIFEPDGQEVVLHEGEAFGEKALVSTLPPISRAVAETDTILWEIHKDDFGEVVAVSPGLQKDLRTLAGTHNPEEQLTKISRKRSRKWLKQASHNLESEVGEPTESEVMRAANDLKRKGGNVALAIWLGIALDGIPESLIIGSSMEGTSVSLALIGGLFLANIPESMSSAVVMKSQGGKSASIIWMWVALMFMTAAGAAIGNLFVSETPHVVQALLEGMAAGAMLAMIAQTMLPEAFDHGGWLTGLMTVIGFLAAIFMGTIDEEKRVNSHPHTPVVITAKATPDSD